MKLSCTLWLSDSDISFERSARLISEAGYNAIEIPAVLQANPDKMRKDDIKRIKTVLERNNLEVSGFCLMYPKDMRHASRMSSDRRRSLDYTKRLVDVASEIGARILVWGSGYARNIPTGISREVGIEWLRGLLKEAGEYAMERDVIIAIEPLNRYESNVVNTVRDAIEMALRVNSAAVRVLCDTFHMNIEETSLRDPIIEVGGMLAHVHLSDSNRALPGRGHINFDEVFEALREIGYDGYVTLEAILGRDISRDLVAARRYLEKFSSDSLIHGR